MKTPTPPRKRVATGGIDTRASISPSPSDIKAAREAAGLTQTEAAALVYRTLRNFQQWEGGERPMDPALWELFGIKAGKLGGTGT